jgi:hypothetical protein
MNITRRNQSSSTIFSGDEEDMMEIDDHNPRPKKMRKKNKKTL